MALVRRAVARVRGETPRRSAYGPALGPPPPCPPGDTETAGAYLSRVDAVLAMSGWTRRERRRLRAIRRKWAARAAGRDHRFRVVGNRRGGLTRHESDAVIISETLAEIRSALNRSRDAQGN